MKKLCCKKYQIIVGTVFLCLLCMNLFFWGSRKEGFFCDELYSYHFTHQVENPYMVEEQDGKTWLNNWHSSAFFQDYLTLTKEESFDVSGVWNTVQADVHPPLFYLFLEVSSSVFSAVFPGIFTKWSGILVNIAFFLLTIFFLWKLSRELTEYYFWAAMTCVLYGFSAGAASMVVFIRMYTIFTCFAVLFTYLNVRLWKVLWSKTEKEKKWLYPALSITAVAGILTQYYFLIYAFLICVVIWGCSLLKRKYIFMTKYTCAMAISLAGSVLIWPDMLDDIFFGYRGEEAFTNLAEGGGLTEALRKLLSIINGELFGKGAVLLLAFFVALLLVRFLSVWWCLETDIAEDGSVHMLFWKRNPRKKLEIRLLLQDIVWVHILFAVSLYIIFMAQIAPYKEDRYIFPVFPMIVLLVVYFVKRLISGMPKNIQTIGITFLFLCMLAGYFSPGVNYLYRGTEDKLETASTYSNLPAFYVTLGSSYRACGDSVYFSMARCTYPISGETLEKIPEALAGLGDTDNTRCLFYIDSFYENREQIVQEIAQMFPAKEMLFLFDTEYSSVYIVE